MRFTKTAILIAAILSFSAVAYSQTGAAQTAAPAKVGAINSATFSNPTGGITRLTNALRSLENEFKPRRDEITQLVTRFDDLQRPPANATPAQLQTRREQAGTLQIDIRRKQEDARVAYAKRFQVLIEPVRLSVFTALEAYAKQRGIDLLIDVSKFPDGILLINPGADMTPAFIRDYNSKNP